MQKIDFDLWKIPHNKISLLDTYISYFIIIFLHLFLANIIMSYQNFYSGGNTNEENQGEKNLVKFIIITIFLIVFISFGIIFFSELSFSESIKSFNEYSSGFCFNS